MDEDVDPLSHASQSTTHTWVGSICRIKYYTAQWYRNLFYRFLDITITNRHILHKEQETKSLSHEAFMEELTADLCGKRLLPGHMWIIFQCLSLTSVNQTSQ